MCERLYFKVSEAAKVVGRSPRTVRRWISERGLPSYRPRGGGNLLVKIEELHAFMERQPTDRELAQLADEVVKQAG